MPTACLRVVGLRVVCVRVVGWVHSRDVVELLQRSSSHEHSLFCPDGDIIVLPLPASIDKFSVSHPFTSSSFRLHCRTVPDTSEINEYT